MNAGATSERVFHALKRYILSGDALPGERLEPASFSERLNSSVTPVRDALHRLVGERLVETRMGEGFYLPLVTEPGLRDLYSWNGQLIRAIVRAAAHNGARPKANELPADIGHATVSFFDLFGAASSNAEHRYQIDLANDRLATARVAERDVLSGLEEELHGLALAYDDAAPNAVLKLVAAYHRRRLRATSSIVRALYR